MGAPPTSKADAALAEHAALLKDAVQYMEKALQIFSMYPRDHEVARRFRGDLADKVRAAAAAGEGWLEVRGKSLSLGKHEIYREPPESLGFVFRLHRDGVRLLCLLPGIGADEVERFAAVLWVPLDDPAYFDANTITLLGDADLDHVRYVVVELLAESPFDGEDQDRARQLMEQIVTAAADPRLPAGYTPRKSQRLLRVSTQALARLTPEQIEGALALAEDAGVEPFAVEAAELGRQLEDPELVRKFVEICHRGLSRPDAGQALLTTLDHLQRSLTQRGAADELAVAATHSAALGQLPGGAALAEQVLGLLLQRAGIELLVQGTSRPRAESPRRAPSCCRRWRWCGPSVPPS